MTTAVARVRTLAPFNFSLQVPSIIAILCALGLGALIVIAHVLTHASTGFKDFLDAMIIFVGGIGISPLVGPAFRAALHAPQWFNVTLTAAITMTNFLLQSQVGMSANLHTAIATVLAVLAGLGYGASAVVMPAIRRQLNDGDVPEAKQVLS